MLNTKDTFFHLYKISRTDIYRDKWWTDDCLELRGMERMKGKVTAKGNAVSFWSEKIT